MVTVLPLHAQLTAGTELHPRASVVGLWVGRFNADPGHPRPQITSATPVTPATELGITHLGPVAERPLSGRGRQAADRRHPDGTLATTRWLVAILKNHQQADGSVRVPQGAASRPRWTRSARADHLIRADRLARAEQSIRAGKLVRLRWNRPSLCPIAPTCNRYQAVRRRCVDFTTPE